MEFGGKILGDNYRNKRLKDILSSNSKNAIQLSDYMKSFPALKKPVGHILVSHIQYNKLCLLIILKI